jgi:hypothetical protein
VKIDKGICLLPSLNRVELLKEFFKCYKEAEWEMPGWLLLDKSDYASKEADYLALELPKNWKIVQTNGVTMGEKCRELWNDYKDLDYVALINDDHRIITKGGDKTMLASLRNHMIMGCNDGPEPSRPWMAPQKLAGITIWAGHVLRTVGYLFPEGLNQLYIDDAWEYLGGQAGAIQILMNVCVHHNHVFKGRGKDSTSDKVYPDGWQDPTSPNGGETRAFNDWKAKEGPKALERLISTQPRQGMMIATASHDGQVAFGYALGLTDLALFLNKNNVHFEMARVVGSSLIPHARNSLIDMFMKSKCQRLLFVDADQIWSKEAALMLFQSNRRIIAGVIPHKRFPINLNFNPLEKHWHYFKDHSNKSSAEYAEYAKATMDKKGEVEVDKAGFGFIMIDRSVIELMMPLVPEYYAFDNNNDVKHKEIFAMGAVDGKYQGEDWAFCALAKKLKIPMYINVNCQVAHMGQFTFQVGM